MSYEDNPQDRLQRLSAKLKPEKIRSTLAFAGLFQMTHEMIKRTVIQDVRNFYGHSSLVEGTWLWGEQGKEMYNRDVISLAPGGAFRASLQWLRDSDAITSTQVARLDEIYTHRHELTHELAKFIVDVDSEPDTKLLTDAVQIMRDISRFWTRVEIDLGTFEDHGEVDVDDVESGPLLVLDMCIHAYIEGLDRSGALS